MKFLFEVHIKQGHTAEQYAAAWLRVSEILQRAPGARGTRLHRQIGDPGRLLAIASWESKAARDAMEARRDETVRAILKETSAICEVTVIGEFDEPEWVVMPPASVPGPPASLR
ncbi:MAG TPA: antibiotic biosynthesis monooxygenase [Steroidobacteraceae bacterium]|nr:antibiotic biosynthesis monooxygenase [Steroidobacteraceae bacterium]